MSWTLNWWQWGAVAWVATGLVVICIAELASRSDQGRGLLSQEGIAVAIVCGATVIAGAPLVLLYILGICCQTLWRGRIPISNRIWWPARAATFSRVDGHPGPETILVEMIELRRSKDARLRHGKEPANWLMWQLWEAPEAVVLSIVENLAWLKDAGLSDHSALQRLEAVDGVRSIAIRERASTLQELVTRQLHMRDPGYLALGVELLTKHIEIADKWAKDELQRTRSQPPHPPTEWLVRRTGVAAVERTWACQHRDWSRMKARMTERDELWEFISPAEDWANLAGRQGIALMRDGRPVFHINTAMN